MTRNEIAEIQVPPPRSGRAGHSASLAAVGFQPSVLVLSDNGLRRAGALNAGDSVALADGGLAEIVHRIDTHAPAGAAGVRIPAAVLGADTPGRDMLVPADQYLRVTGSMVERICGEPHALVPARHLCGRHGIRPTILTTFRGVHLLLDRPGQFCVEGLAVAPFLPEAEAVQALDAEARASLLAAYPRARYPGAHAALDSDLPVIDEREVNWLGDDWSCAVARDRLAGTADWLVDPTTHRPVAASEDHIQPACTVHRLTTSA